MLMNDFQKQVKQAKLATDPLIAKRIAKCFNKKIDASDIEETLAACAIQADALGLSLADCAVGLIRRSGT